MELQIKESSLKNEIISLQEKLNSKKPEPTAKINENLLESQNLQNNESGNDLMASLKSKAFQLTGFSPKMQDHPFFTEKPTRSLIYSENLEESQNILRESIKSKLMKEKE